MLRLRRRPRPFPSDLAIDVVWTGGGLRKLDIYAKLGVPEVWFGRRDRITIHQLRGERYEPVDTSQVLVGVEVAELASYLDRPMASQAIREYRALLLARTR